MNNAGRGNRSPALNCSFVKSITFSSPFSVGIAASSFTKFIYTSFGMQNRSRNSFTSNLSIAFSPASLTRADEIVFFGAISYHKAKPKSTYKSNTTVQTKQSENTQTLTQNSRENPLKNPSKQQQSTNIQQQLQATCPKQCPSKPETKFKEPANATKGMTVAKRYVPNKALKKKNGYCLGTKSPAANKRSRDTKTPVQKSFRTFSQRCKGRRKKQKEERLSRKCSRKKCKKRYSALFIAGQPCYH